MLHSQSKSYSNTNSYTNAVSAKFNIASNVQSLAVPMAIVLLCGNSAALVCKCKELWMRTISILSVVLAVGIAIWTPTFGVYTKVVETIKQNSRNGHDILLSIYRDENNHLNVDGDTQLYGTLLVPGKLDELLNNVPLGAS
ncbi:hypothetical protein DASB73_034600 [Starmerella bacillaris]|uniref:Uncharacterized protein n=1 Tax=Starmerella bacillaris TaxID=1247836 RepID=A0AAV5RMZ6_STABA|nr:hypothetical protein DASB73_034600 [Starmerella bacillaris]